MAEFDAGIFDGATEDIEDAVRAHKESRQNEDGFAKAQRVAKASGKRAINEFTSLPMAWQSAIFGLATVIAVLLMIGGAMGIRSMIYMLTIGLAATKAFEIAWYIRDWLFHRSEDV